MLEDILEAIAKIARYTPAYDLRQFIADEKTVDAVVRNLEIIGEAVTKLPENLKSQNPDVDWKRLKGMRNRIVHEYFGVDLGIVWTIITEQLPIFEKQIVLILNQLYNDKNRNLNK